MAENIIKKIQIKQLPSKPSIVNEDYLIIDDGVTTSKSTADSLADFVVKNQHTKAEYISRKSIGEANGVTPLNSNKKIDGKYVTYGTTASTSYEGSAGKILEQNLDNHLVDSDAHGYNTKINNEIDRAKKAEATHSTNTSNPHKVTKTQIGLGSVNNTSDANKPVSTAQQKAINDAYANSNAYTDKKIADLINGAPETLDTLKEIADAIESSKTVEEALNKAIGIKANQTELDSHTNNSTIHVTATERTNWDKAYTHSTNTHAPTNAEVNQNAFSNVKIGTTTISAKTKTDNLVLEGKNVTLTPDVTNKKVTVGITKDNVISALGYTPGKGGTDTKNTTGSTDTTGKLFLVGAKTQSEYAKTYSESGVYIDNNGNLCSNNKIVSTTDHTHDEYINVSYDTTEPINQRVGDLWCPDYK